MNKALSCVVVYAFVYCYCFNLVNAQYNFNGCSTPNQQPGTCIPIPQCPSLFSLISKKPLTQHDRGFLATSQCGYFNRVPYVCCPVDNGFGSDSQTPVGGGLTEYDLPQPGHCGTQLTEKITGGNMTKIDEYPWLVILQYTKPSGEKVLQCGGSLIHKNYVITAAHCVSGKDIKRLGWRVTAVRLGEWDLSSTRDCLDPNYCADPIVEVPVTETITHELYRPESRSNENDITLLRLGRPVETPTFIRPVCLPLAQHLRNQDYNGASLHVAGWGATATTRFSNIKLKADIKGVSLDQCNQVYRVQSVQLSDVHMCAGGVKGIDSCRGDSGGPLVGFDESNRNNKYFYLAGLVSFGPSPCGGDGWPGVYARVDRYLDWILSKMHH